MSPGNVGPRVRNLVPEEWQRIRNQRDVGYEETILRVTIQLLLTLALLAGAARESLCEEGRVAGPGPSIANVLASVCADCHNGETTEGDLDLGAVSWTLSDRKVRDDWVLIHDRIAKHEMPPDPNMLPDEDRELLLRDLSTALHGADLADVTHHGRGPLRRLTRREYEQNLRDLLQLPHLDIRDLLPADREKHHCNKVADVLDVSRVQLAAYLDAADAALRRAVASGMKPRDAIVRRFPATSMFEQPGTFGGREAMFYTKTSKLLMFNHAELARVRTENSHDPEIEMCIFRSTGWPYYGYPFGFIASEPGEYRVRFSARAVRQVRDFRIRPAHAPQPMTFRARKKSGPDVSGDVRATGGVIDIRPAVGVYETTIRLKRNETFEYSLLGLPVPRAINPPNAPLYYDFPPMPESGHPGVAFQWLELTGPIDSQIWPPPSHRVLFGELPIRPATGGRLAVEIVTNDPQGDAIRLLRRFLSHAQRQPLPASVVGVYERLVLNELQDGVPLTEALLSGYTAFLCSGQFVYLQEPLATESRHYDIASRLSHFLANTHPDAELASHAASADLLKADTLRRESNRLIESAAFDRFIIDFTDHWLSLKDVRRDEPDVRLYPEYRFDDYLIESLEAETRAFVTMMFRENLPITNLAQSDFVLINDRLARHYDLPPLTGSRLRRVDLLPGSPYGGLLTQGAIMKVTADGTSTSPVIRGAWLMERIVGDPPPPPPTSVPAIEPDVRGATSIRELLARHTADASCRNCHARFDPVGFGLENFDIMGAWRDRYRSLTSGEEVTGIDRAGHDFSYHVAGPVDSAGELRGQTFQSVAELKTLLASNPRQLARNLLHRLVVYATGTPVRFSDRQTIESILDRSGRGGFRTRDLVLELVQSRIFTGQH